MLAHDHMIVAGTISASRARSRGKHMIEYKFVALDGREYTGKSDWERRPTIGTEIVVLYNPLHPSTNQPFKRFLFYSFQTMVLRQLI